MNECSARYKNNRSRVYIPALWFSEKKKKEQFKPEVRFKKRVYLVRNVVGGVQVALRKAYTCIPTDLSRSKRRPLSSSAQRPF